MPFMGERERSASVRLRILRIGQVTRRHGREAEDRTLALLQSRDVFPETEKRRQRRTAARR